MTTTLVGSDRVPVIAVGLVEWDRRTGRPTKDNRLRYDGIIFMPGQRTVVRARDARKLARARQLQIVEDLPVVDWWREFGDVLMVEPGTAAPRLRTPTATSLRVLQGTGYDPGNAAYRFDAALNECSEHRSVLVRHLIRGNNPFRCPSAVNATRDPAMARALALTADVIHYHIDTILTQNLGLPRRPRSGQVTVKHYHGTRFNGLGQQEPDEEQEPILRADQDDRDEHLLVGARLTVCALRPGRIHWLPIAVPVDRYAAMVALPPLEGRPFRIAHSPTKTLIKGTREFVRACRRLTRRGLPVTPVLIQHQTHAAALALRATADATFDSFALGIQGSGLEAAAMGQPVIAGDFAVADLYRETLGSVPYTFAGDAATLERTIEQLATDATFRDREARRVHAYCRQFHDYPVVAARYSQLLSAAGARQVA